MAQDARELKIMALKEVISRDKVQYEDQIADLRVQLTQVSEQLEEANAEKTRLADELARAVESPEIAEKEVVQGELVQEKSTRARKSS